MKNIWGVIAAVLLSVSVSGTAFSQDGEAAKPKKEFSEKQKAQHQRMRDCNAEAKEKGLKGQDRKDFMKTCLSGGKVTAQAGEASASTPDRSAQKEKMKSCNAEAKTQGLKGDARKDFMSQCLSK
jgi:hypothetical protein